MLDLGKTQDSDRVSRRRADSPEETYFAAQKTFGLDTETVETDDQSSVFIYDTGNGSNAYWPDDETLARHKDRCAKHKRYLLHPSLQSTSKTLIFYPSECKKMQVEVRIVSILGKCSGTNE